VQIGGAPCLSANSLHWFEVILGLVKIIDLGEQCLHTLKLFSELYPRPCEIDESISRLSGSRRLCLKQAIQSMLTTLFGISCHVGLHYATPFPVAEHTQSIPRMLFSVKTGLGTNPNQQEARPLVGYSRASLSFRG
jgi:hypothetical protein